MDYVDIYLLDHPGPDYTDWGNAGRIEWSCTTGQGPLCGVLQFFRLVGV